MEEVKINTSKTLTISLPVDPDLETVSVSLYHELGDLVSGPTSALRTSAGEYSITFGQEDSGIYILNSSGRYKADFTYEISGTEYTQSKYINVFTPYITAAEFFDEYPELENEFETKFDAIAKRIKNTIDTYCGQSFEYYENKTIQMNGNNYSNLRLPLPVIELTSVIQDPGTNDELVLLSATIDKIEKVRQPFNFDSTYNIRFKKTSLPEQVFVLGKWNLDSTYKINGNFGWKYVPDNVKQAASLLIADAMNNDSEYRMHGMTRVEMDALTVYMKNTFYETTGNIEADVLLMDYTLFVMDYIV